MNITKNVFDGTNNKTIETSFAKALQISTEELNLLLNLFLIKEKTDLNSPKFTLDNFLKYCKESNQVRNITLPFFDKVIFFHKTSTIDNGNFLKENGLLDLDKLLTLPSPLFTYLKSKGIEFVFTNENVLINISGKVMPLMDLPCNKIISSKRRIISRLIKTTDYPLEGITGFLFLEDALINPTYQYINHAPEFLIDLDNCISGILKEWQNSSEQLIVKCEADLTSWYCPGDNKQEESPSKKSYKIGIEAFDYLAKLYGKNYRFSLGKKSPDYYPFISYGNGIPAEKIIEIISPSSR